MNMGRIFCKQKKLPTLTLPNLDPYANQTVFSVPQLWSSVLTGFTVQHTAVCIVRCINMCYKIFTPCLSGFQGQWLYDYYEMDNLGYKIWDWMVMLPYSYMYMGGPRTVIVETPPNEIMMDIYLDTEWKSFYDMPSGEFLHAKPQLIM